MSKYWHSPRVTQIIILDKTLIYSNVTCLVRVAEDGLLLMGPWAMSHPHRNGERLLQVGAHHAIRNLNSLGAIELKHLVTVMPIVSGQSNCPVDRAAGCRQKFHSAWGGTWKYRTRQRQQNLSKRNLYSNNVLQSKNISSWTITDRKACAVTSQNKCHGHSPSQYGWFPVQHWLGSMWLAHHRSPSACWGKGPGYLCRAHIQSSYWSLKDEVKWRKEWWTCTSALCRLHGTS